MTIGVTSSWFANAVAVQENASTTARMTEINFFIAVPPEFVNSYSLLYYILSGKSTLVLIYDDKKYCKKL